MSEESFEDVRSLLAEAPMVEPRAGAMERIVAAVAAADEIDPSGAAASATAGVVDLAERRRLRRYRWAPRVAAAAAALAIVAAVVGGVGGDARLPAIGDLVSRHQAAASEAMPSTAEPMPMSEAHEMEPEMPATMSMTDAFTEADGTVHLVYAGPEGHVVSVFRQRGDTDLEDLGVDGDVEMMGDSPVWTTVMKDMHVAVVDGDGFVWTVVTDHHDEEMMKVMTDDLPGRSDSFLDRIRDVAEEVLEPWRFGI